MSIKTIMTAASVAILMSAGSALAQSAAPAAQPSKPVAAAKTTTPAKPAKAAKAKAPAKTAKPRSAESLKCSADADAKGLKGAERKKFRTACMKAARKSAKAKKAETKAVVPPLPAKKS